MKPLVRFFLLVCLFALGGQGVSGNPFTGHSQENGRALSAGFSAANEDLVFTGMPAPAAQNQDNFKLKATENETEDDGNEEEELSLCGSPFTIINCFINLFYGEIFEQPNCARNSVGLPRHSAFTPTDKYITFLVIRI
jgi:hypothetical protein